MDSDIDRYTAMQKAYYTVDGANDPAMDAIVGEYAKHEAYPYDLFLLRYHQSGPDQLALDFGCGPGRMIRRMSKFFKRVDGCDISAGMIDGARRRCLDLEPGPNLYLTDGQNLNGVPSNEYDFVYCTISFHHIASYPIRMNLLKEFARVLRPGGSVALQLLYTTSHPRNWPHHVDWRESKHDAPTTNGYHDVRITSENLPQVEEDFASVGLKEFMYRLDAPPWPHENTTDFIFLYARKA